MLPAAPEGLGRRLRPVQVAAEQPGRTPLGADSTMMATEGWVQASQLQGAVGSSLRCLR